MPKCPSCGSVRFFCENDHEYHGNKELCYRRVSKSAAESQMKSFDTEEYRVGRRIVEVVRKKIDTYPDYHYFKSSTVIHDLEGKTLITTQTLKLALDFLVCDGLIERIEHNVAKLEGRGHKYRKLPAAITTECRSFIRDPETGEFYCEGLNRGEFRNYTLEKDRKITDQIDDDEVDE